MSAVAIMVSPRFPDKMSMLSYYNIIMRYDLFYTSLWYFSPFVSYLLLTAVILWYVRCHNNGKSAVS
jgi:hypothetical protein